MSFKQFAATENAANKGKPAETSKTVEAADTKEKTPKSETPAAKS